MVSCVVFTCRCTTLVSGSPVKLIFTWFWSYLVIPHPARCLHLRPPCCRPPHTSRPHVLPLVVLSTPPLPRPPPTNPSRLVAFSSPPWTRTLKTRRACGYFGLFVAALCTKSMTTVNSWLTVTVDIALPVIVHAVYAVFKWASLGLIMELVVWVRT